MQNIPINQITPTRHPLTQTQLNRTTTLIHTPETPHWEIQRAQIITLVRDSNHKSHHAQYASGLTAAQIRNIPLWHTTHTIELISTAPAKFHTSKIATTKYQIKRVRRTYPPEAYTQISDIPTLSPEYLILEILRLPNPITAFVSADAILRQITNTDRKMIKYRHAEIHQAKQALLRLATPENLGKFTKRVRRRIPLLDPYSESPAESALRIMLLQLRQESLQSQHQVPNPRGGFYYGDIYIPALHTICEADGAMKYADASAYQAEKEREINLNTAGYRVVRMHWRELTSPEALAILAGKLHLPFRKRPATL
ncbi:endonuclease domain-containing protein [Gleimia sp. 6138-11-ORH1]|uniref:endonuclease domain-containing protein n=1 Tax=Gleimia sp. 6138-11-ORH1 TaxID=2973937 RepID=UPI002167CBBD|nr:endonuclease domain-containing protein [Gleimia sp. 6138-11-ORH1]MCS4483917.1 endonuclease domain-containing protein [Gleimia sp. 6138-11-ORH1]